ncbi:hypothetical protein LIER_11836 [Lithospermum erythrorhizon]|uniref:Uncharacterized protein n=1 Tax=Lithospermum erythrorhizon TaxID=34254 RepID=A0AAV3PTW1_LITER
MTPLILGKKGTSPANAVLVPHQVCPATLIERASTCRLQGCHDIWLRSRGCCMATLLPRDMLIVPPHLGSVGVDLLCILPNGRYLRRILPS